jgi:hypothetical protein
MKVVSSLNAGRKTSRELRLLVGLEAGGSERS